MVLGKCFPRGWYGVHSLHLLGCVVALKELLDARLDLYELYLGLSR